MNARIVPAVPISESHAFPDPNAEEGSKTHSLLGYWSSITHRKWSILGLTLAITLLTSLYVNSITPTYRATASVLFDQQKNKIVSIEELYAASGNREFYQTQIEIMRSRELVTKVAKKLKLSTEKEFDPRQQEPPYWVRWLEKIGMDPQQLGLAAPNVSGITEESVVNSLPGQILSRLVIEQVRGSQLVRIHVDAHDPIIAAKVANAVAETLIESDLEARYQMTSKASDWLAERLGALRQKVEASERALQQYREKERIVVDAKGAVQGGPMRQMDEYARALSEAKQRRAEAESRYSQIRGIRGTSIQNFESAPVVMNNAMIGRAREAELEAERKVAEFANRYAKEHPRMVQAEAELKAARESARRALDTVVASIVKEAEVARANEVSLERNLAQATEDVQNTNRKEFQLNLLEREVATNRQLYELFFGRSKETSAVSGMQSTFARVVDPALPPGGPYKPNTRQVTTQGFFAGLLIAIMLAVLLDRLDNTVKNSSDVESKLQMAVLASLPIITDRKHKVARMFLDNVHSIFSEGIRTARTGILLSSVDIPHKTIVVTSSIPGEGKTTFAMNLAFALAQTKRVVLVDADLRRPSIGKTLGKEATAPGLSNLVAGTVPAAECIFKVEGSELYVVPSGTVPPNPLELLISKRFEDALIKLTEMFDLVVLDSPPVQLVSDALVIARHTTGTIYVVKADETPYQMARTGLKRLRQGHASLIGVVLNQLDFQRADRYYGEYSGYSKYGYRRYYGQPQSKKRKAAA